MSWKDRGRASVENIRALDVERRSVREVGEQLKTELSDLMARTTRVNEVNRKVAQMWLSIDSPSDGSRLEYISFVKESARLSGQIHELMDRSDEELYEITLAIAATSKNRFSQRLALTVHMHALLRGKLETDMPRCREIALQREQLAQRRKEFVEDEIHGPNL